MEAEALKVLFVGNGGQSSQDIAEAVRKTGGTIESTGFDSAVSMLKRGAFRAVLFEPNAPNTASLFQVTALTVQAPKVPIIVVGSAADQAFAVEAIAAGAQDFMAREELTPEKLERKIRCAIERQYER